jgi:hypothetical protein
MQQTSKDIEKIIEQSNRWIKFGLTFPVIFIVIAMILNMYQVVNLLHVAYVAAGISGVVCFAWWFWALRVIVKMGELNKHARDDLTEVAKDVKMMTREVREANHNLYVILSKYKDNKEPTVFVGQSVKKVNSVKPKK